MKKILLLAVLVVCGASSAFSQTSFNVKAGVNLSNFMSDYDTKVKVGFKAGLGREYQFNELISLQPSLMVATKGTKMGYFATVGSVTSKTEFKVNQTYLELPVLVGFRFYLGGNTNLVLSVGPYFGFGVGGKTKLSGNVNIPGLGDFGSSSSTDTFGTDDDDMGLKRFDVGAAVGLAFEFGKFFVGIDSEFGFIDIAKDSFFADKVNNISVGVGV